MRKEIIFPFDDENTVTRKISDIKRKIGEDNISTYNTFDNNIMLVTIRCTKKQWKKIKKMLDLGKIYW